jgi:hypothetical protein
MDPDHRASPMAITAIGLLATLEGVKKDPSEFH